MNVRIHRLIVVCKQDVGLPPFPFPHLTFYGQDLFDIQERVSYTPPYKISLNILRFHQILRPNELFHTFLLVSPVNLTSCY
jgi:hypothetical protein